MTREEIAVRLVRLRPDLLNIVGFHDLLDAEAAAKPLDAMRYQVHFTASSLHVAQQLLEIVNQLLDDEGL